MDKDMRKSYLLGWLDAWRWLASHPSPTIRAFSTVFYAEYLRRAAN